MSQEEEAIDNQETLKAAAEMYGVDVDEVWRAINEGYVPPDLVQPDETWKTRTQISANVTQEQRDALQTLAADKGLSWSELCGKLADGKLRLKPISD